MWVPAPSWGASGGLWAQPMAKRLLGPCTVPPALGNRGLSRPWPLGCPWAGVSGQGLCLCRRGLQQPPRDKDQGTAPRRAHPAPRAWLQISHVINYKLLFPQLLLVQTITDLK